MGRTVSVPRGVTAVVYNDVSDFGYSADDETREYFDEVICEMDWQDYVDSIVDIAKGNWASFSDCDKWLGREDHAILENAYAYIGVSEYCGLASVWLIAKDDLDSLQERKAAYEWCERISEKFKKLFGELELIGVMSNGEAMYRRNYYG